MIDRGHTRSWPGRSTQGRVERAAQDGAPCVYCQRPMAYTPRPRALEPRYPTRDHVLPRSRYKESPVVWACHGCNADKADRTIEEWSRQLEQAGDPRSPIVHLLLKASEGLSA